MTTGYVSEIFCSIQGEGPLVGQRQVFFRTGGCSATCRWCDTVYSKVRSPRCVIHLQGDEAAMCHWLRASNRQLEGVPLLLLVDEDRLSEVLDHLRSLPGARVYR